MQTERPSINAQCPGARQLAADLAQAERSRVPIAPLTDGNPDIDVVDAYEIQLLNIRQRVAEGARVIGHKVGLSCKAMQEMMDVDEPDYGHLLADMEVFEDEPGPSGAYLLPARRGRGRLRPRRDLPGAGCTEDDVLAATPRSRPAIELIDSRILDWNIRIGDTIADNASSAGYVLGPERVSPEDVDLKTHRGGADPQRRGGRRGPLRRGARQPGDRRGLAGPQGGRLRGPPRGGDTCCPARAPRRSTHGPATSSSPTSPASVRSD